MLNVEDEIRVINRIIRTGCAKDHDIIFALQYPLLSQESKETMVSSTTYEVIKIVT